MEFYIKWIGFLPRFSADSLELYTKSEISSWMDENILADVSSDASVKLLVLSSKMTSLGDETLVAEKVQNQPF